MDVENQVLFLVISANFTHSKPENEDLQKTASQLKLTHYSYREMAENNLYAMNQVFNCKVTSGFWRQQRENYDVHKTVSTRNQRNSL